MMGASRIAAMVAPSEVALWAHRSSTRASMSPKVEVGRASVSMFGRSGCAPAAAVDGDAGTHRDVLDRVDLGDGTKQTLGSCDRARPGLAR